MISGGTWHGKIFQLREFSASPGGGSIKNVKYVQTMARITLTYDFPAAAAALSAKDLVVELSSWELKVQVADNPELTQKLSAISGDLWGDVRRDLSWWALDKENGTTTFTIELAKKDHKAWTGIWKSGINPRRRQSFGWTSAMNAPTKKAEDMLVKLRVGRPARADREPFVVGRETLCVDLEEGDDNVNATVRIHLHTAALEKVCETVCLGNLFGVDVTERYIKVFIRGDERSPILMGELGGSCIPDRTTWEIVKIPSSERNEPMSTALRVQLTKDSRSRSKWGKIIIENPNVLARDAAPECLEALEHSLRPRTPSPDRSAWTPQEHAKECKAKGDAAFKRSDFADAAVYYTRAIGHTPDDNKLYSNRSACYVKTKKFDKALNDAQKCLSLDGKWLKAYFRQGQALRGLRRWEDAINAFVEGRFRDPENQDWDREIEKTREEQERHEEKTRNDKKLKREADLTTELNEASTVAEQQAMVHVSEQALGAGKSPKEAGELAMKGAELAKQRVHEMANVRKKAMMVEDDMEADAPAPYRIVCEDGSVHPKGFAHTDKGMYYMGMTLMNYKAEPGNQVWVEIHHPRKLRWSQGCAQIKIKVPLPTNVQSSSEIEVQVTASHLRIGTKGDADPIVEGELERKVEPDGDGFYWYLVPGESPPLMDVCIDKDASEVWQTFSYTTLLWPRLFKDDPCLGEGLFEADLTDLPAELQAKYEREQARANENSRSDRSRKEKMTEDEIDEETARNWNDEFAKHGIPHRMDTREDENLAKLKYT